MITSEKVRETTYQIEVKINSAPFRISAEYIEDELEAFRKYITQQEKVNELLELYQKKDKIGRKYGEEYDYADIWNEIDKLERELNE